MVVVTDDHRSRSADRFNETDFMCTMCTAERAEYECKLCDDDLKYFCGSACFNNAHRRVKEGGHVMKELRPHFDMCDGPFRACCYGA